MSTLLTIELTALLLLFPDTCNKFLHGSGWLQCWMLNWPRQRRATHTELVVCYINFNTRTVARWHSNTRKIYISEIAFTIIFFLTQHTHALAHTEIRRGYNTIENSQVSEQFGTYRFTLIHGTLSWTFCQSVKVILLFALKTANVYLCCFENSSFSQIGLEHCQVTKKRGNIFICALTHLF